MINHWIRGAVARPKGTHGTEGLELAGAGRVTWWIVTLLNMGMALSRENPGMTGLQVS